MKMDEAGRQRGGEPREVIKKRTPPDCLAAATADPSRGRREVGRCDPSLCENERFSDASAESRRGTEPTLGGCQPIETPNLTTRLG